DDTIAEAMHCRNIHIRFLCPIVSIQGTVACSSISCAQICTGSEAFDGFGAKMIAEGVRIILQTIRHGIQALIPIFLLLLYTILGAVIFYYVESPNEQTELETLKRERAELLESTAYRLNDVRGMKPINAYNHTVSTLESYRKKLGVADIDEIERKWTMWGAIFYALTVYTTIGYGNIYPVTTPGRVITIIYAFIGIPLALISLIALGSLFARICKILWTIILTSLKTSTGIVSKDLERQVDKLSKVTNSPKKEASDETDLLSFPVSFLIGLTFLWVFVCAALFLTVEDQWNYGTSLYFTLISFTTIGFGDVLPSKPDFMLFVGFCLLIGLSLVSTVLTIIQQQIEALASGLDDDIDKQYTEALNAAYADGAITNEEAKLALEHGNGEGDQTESLLENARQPKLDSMQLEAIVARLPLKSRLMYYAMSNQNRKRIAKKVESRMNVRVAGTQTDAYLLQSLIEEHLHRVGFKPPSFENIGELCNLVIKSIGETEL
uniref:Potassium channel domain-containing protein n=1 Tax=Parascaris univalens TaxID=6257 RepID=A0A914ZNI9_PARUN